MPNKSKNKNYHSKNKEEIANEPDGWRFELCMYV